MSKRLPIFYSALMLTGVNLVLRFVGTSFQVYLSGKIGAENIGLLQLVMSVGGLAMVAGMGGIRTATMYLTAEELGQKRRQNIPWVLSGCMVYSILFSAAVSLLLNAFAPQLADRWIGDGRTLPALRLYAAFLPCVCLCGVMTGYFTAANRIGTLAAVEVAEQLISMVLTMTLLSAWAGHDPVRACLCVILGSSLGAGFTLLCLMILHLRDRVRPGPAIPVAGRLCHAALPLAVADDMRTGISTVENLMVPKRLALCKAVDNPLAAFGTVSGMVFPVLMFPACILYGLAELLIPELARCNAGKQRVRISYLVQRSLKVALLYGLVFCGLIYLLAEPLCLRLYQSPEAGQYLRLYALLIPMLYCDAITDAMTKGLGQQKICVRYNILTNILDVVLLFLFLPRWGMKGYYVSFLITHLLNFALSLRRLLIITGEKIPLRVPLLSLCALAGAIFTAKFLKQPLQRSAVFPVVLGCLLCLLQITGRGDIFWLLGLITGKEKQGSPNCPAS